MTTVLWNSTAEPASWQNIIINAQYGLADFVFGGTLAAVKT